MEALSPLVQVLLPKLRALSDILLEDAPPILVAECPGGVADVLSCAGMGRYREYAARLRKLFKHKDIRLILAVYRFHPPFNLPYRNDGFLYGMDNQGPFALAKGCRSRQAISPEELIVSAPDPLDCWDLFTSHLENAIQEFLEGVNMPIQSPPFP